MLIRLRYCSTQSPRQMRQIMQSAPFGNEWLPASTAMYLEPVAINEPRILKYTAERSDPTGPLRDLSLQRSGDKVGAFRSADCRRDGRPSAGHSTGRYCPNAPANRSAVPSQPAASGHVSHGPVAGQADSYRPKLLDLNPHKTRTLDDPRTLTEPSPASILGTTGA